jgi:hypothetical protein
VVGGAAAVLHGAPITTQDLDIVHRRTGENVQRLASLLAELDVTTADTKNRARIKNGGLESKRDDVLPR